MEGDTFLADRLMSCKIPPKIKISHFAIMQSTLMELCNNVTFNVSLKTDRGESLNFICFGYCQVFFDKLTVATHKE
jgi:hypothetical protein